MAETVALQRVQRPPRGMRLAGVALTLLVTTTAILWIVPGWLDWSRYRGAIAHFAADELGRPVQIDGPISVMLLPAPVVTAGNVRLGDRGDGIALTAPALRLRLALAPLLLGRVIPRELVLSRPSITLPWPLPPAALASGRPDWLSASTARIEGGRLAVGALQFTDLDADLSAGGPEVGGIEVSGIATGFGQRWRFSNRLGAPDVAGDAPVEAVLDALPQSTRAPVPDTALRLSGTLSHDGALAGRLTAHAADLSQLLPAPPIAATADGTLSVGRGPAQAQLALNIGGVAMLARLRPGGANGAQVLSLSTGRLDLDAWDKALAKLRTDRTPSRMIRLPWPVSLDLAADAVQLRGGLIRAFHAVLDIDGAAGTLHTASAVLPGEAVVTLTGSLAEAEGLALSADWTLDAPQLRTTLRWLASCGLRIGADLPPEVLRQAKLAGHVTATRDRVEVGGLHGTLEQSALGGRIDVDPASGAIDAALTLDHLQADDWLPPGTRLQWPALSRNLADFDLALKLHVDQVQFRGDSIGNLVLDAATDAGGLAVNAADFDIDGLHGHAAGTIGGDGQVTGAALDLSAPKGTALQHQLPAWARFTDFLWSGPVHLNVTANGPMDALIASVGLDLDDARLEAHPLIDLANHTWSAQLTLRHPGAPRLLAALGIPHARDWLGEGSISLLAQLSGTPGNIRLDSFDLTAAMLHATGDLQLADASAAVPMLTGHVAADTLPLPFYTPRDQTPGQVAWLSHLNARLALTASTVIVGDAELLHGAQAALELAGGVLKLGALKATLGGGLLTGSAVLDVSAAPPRVSATAHVTGATLGAPLFGTPLDLAGGLIDCTLDLTAEGYSPAAVLASLAGNVQLSASAGSISGFDLAAAHLAGTDAAALNQALGGGTTRFDTLQTQVALAGGTAALHHITLAGPDGAAEIDGTVDLPSATVNLLARLPDQRDLRLTGPIQAPYRIIGSGSP